MTGIALRAPSDRPSIRLYPLVFPVALVVLAWSSANIHVAVLARPLAVTLAASLLILGVCTWLARDADVGGLLATLVLLALVATDPRVLAIVAALAVVVGIVAVRGRGLERRPPVFGLATRILRGVAIVLMLALTIKLVSDGVPQRVVGEVVADAHGRVRGATASDAPDIVVLLLDGFPGQRATAAAGGDDAPFIDALESRGFDVQSDSHSNYLFTGLTLASMFEMRHVHDQAELGPPWDAGDDDARRLRSAINGGEALDRLAAAGYELTSVASGFDHAEVRRVDRFVTPWQPSEFEVAYLRLIAAGDLLDAAFPDLLSGLHRQRILDTFKATRELATEAHAAPRLVYGHVPAPHAPWVFGLDGRSEQARLTTFYSDDPGDLGLDRSAAFARSRDQAAYVAGIALETVDSILAGATRPVVLIVMSDHGSGVGLDPRDAGDTDLVERFSNLMAVRAPDGRDLVRDRLTPVNLFPRILDAYLGSDIQESGDGTYAWRESYLDTVPVTPVPEWQP